MGTLLIETTGKTVSPAYAKATSAAFVGLKVDNLAEIKGVDETDKIEAEYRAEENAHSMYDDHYIQGHGAENYKPGRYGPHESHGRWQIRLMEWKYQANMLESYM
ncbi:hypothetical protein N7523_008824 [Penicillium sp. IBT 18751x]|nr:hypothetical protein N7523_008824 [Penicillium sp. IBT 18751x]